jgi:hypothetical protein
MKKLFCIMLLCIATNVFAFDIGNTTVPNARAYLKHEDGATSVVVQELCVLREIVVANSMTLLIIKDDKLVGRGCVTMVKGELAVVFEGEAFKLTMHKIDLSKWIKVEQERVETQKYF